MIRPTAAFVGVIANYVIITEGASPSAVGMYRCDCCGSAALIEQNHKVSEASKEQYEHGKTRYRNTGIEMLL